MLRLARLCLLLALFTALSAGTVTAAGARVYLMRGLLDVSTGLDDLAAKLKRRKISASITSYTAEADVAATAITNFRADGGCPVVIIGHSLGADAAVGVARALQRARIPVALLVAFSPASSGTIPGNVARVVNYYQSNSVWNNVYSGGSAFHGSLRNVNLASKGTVDHFNIEKLASLHTETIRTIENLGNDCELAGGRHSNAAAVKH